MSGVPNVNEVQPKAAVVERVHEFVDENRTSFLVRIGQDADGRDTYARLMPLQREYGSPKPLSYWQNGVLNWNPIAREDVPADVHELAQALEVALAHPAERSDPQPVSEEPAADLRHPGIWKGGIQVSGRPVAGGPRHVPGS